MLAGHSGGPIVVGIRPEDLEDASIDPAADTKPTITGRVELVESLGSELVVHAAIAAKAAETGDPDAVEEVALDGAQSICTGRFNPRSRVARGDNIHLSVDADRLRFFDLETGLAIRGS